MSCNGCRSASDTFGHASATARAAGAVGTEAYIRVHRGASPRKWTAVFTRMHWCSIVTEHAVSALLGLRSCASLAPADGGGRECGGHADFLLEQSKAKRMLAVVVVEELRAGARVDDPSLG